MYIWSNHFERFFYLAMFTSFIFVPSQFNKKVLRVLALDPIQLNQKLHVHVLQGSHTLNSYLDGLKSKMLIYLASNWYQVILLALNMCVLI